MLSELEAKKCFQAYLANNKHVQMQGKRLEDFIVRFRKYIPLLKELDLKTWNEYAHKLNLDSRDKGIDLVGVANDKNGIYPIQSKNYIGKNKIHRRAIDAFINRTRLLKDIDIINAYLIFNGMLTNDAEKQIDENNENLKKTGSKWQIKKIDLDEIFPDLYENLTITDPNKLASQENFNQYLTGSNEAKKEPKSLRPYQKAAVAKAEEHYIKNQNSRGQMIMACGTGKTLTSLAIVKKITKFSDIILFLVPTLDLMRQTIKVARIDTNFDFGGFAVCSDYTTIKNDEPNFSDAQLPINEILRDPQDMISFYEKWNNQQNNKRLIIFCTYQSIDKIVKAQSKGFPEFKLVICDEAHRTVGLKDSEKLTSNFQVVHDNDKLKAHKRLYMTATPKLFTHSKKTKKDLEGKKTSVLEDVVLWDMNDINIYGQEFFIYSFTEGVSNNYLSDFQVVILGLLQEEFEDVYYEYKQEFNEKPINKNKNFMELSDFVNLIGISNIIDEYKIKKAISFCRYATKNKGNSKTITDVFNNVIVPKVMENTKKTLFKMKHIDGTMNASQRKSILSKFDEIGDQSLIVSNARCLSEGVDVPSLDAVIFLHPRKSEVDIVQAVGRVMRKSENKKIGRVIIPVIGKLKTKNKDISIDLDQSRFKAVSEILNALRSPRVKSSITQKLNNASELGDDFPTEDIEIRVEINPEQLIKAIRRQKNQGQQNWLDQIPGEGWEEDSNFAINNNTDSLVKEQISEQMKIKLQDLKTHYENILKSGIVKKVGSRSYWEYCMERTLKDTIDPIRNYLTKSYEKQPKIWTAFLKKMKLTINPNINKNQVINFVIDHLNTEKIFNAVYPGSLSGNSIAKVINNFIAKLDLSNKLSKEYEKIINLNHSLEQEIQQEVQAIAKTAQAIKNDRAKQELIKKIYEKYLGNVYGEEAKKNGTYYTPVAIVDYLLRAAAYLLKSEFNIDFNSSSVRVLDPFVGTGTFITRLFSQELDLITTGNILVKSDSSEIWGNEIMLLAYYIATINISQAINQRLKNKHYYSFKNIVWTDTFQLFERQVPLFNDDQNLKMIAEQQKQNINVIIGNPPYSADGNQHYPSLEKEITKSWAGTFNSTSKKNVYDSYLKGIMYSIKLLAKKNSGIIAFITNNGYLRAKSLAGFRLSLKKYFTKLYIIDLKGNSRNETTHKTKKQGAPVFERTMIGTALFIGVVKKNPNDKSPSEIFYKSVDNNLKRSQKIKWLAKNNLSFLINKNKFQKLDCDGYGDWFDKRRATWRSNMTPLYVKNNDRNENFPLFKKGSNGIQFCDLNLFTNFNKSKIGLDMQKLIRDWNDYIDDKTKKWPIKYNARELQFKAKKNKKSAPFDKQYLHLISTAPFVFKYCYYDPFFPLYHYQFKSIFPFGQNKKNLLINFGRQPFAVNTFVHFHFLLLDNSTINYPRFCYVANQNLKSLFSDNNETNLTDNCLNYFDYQEMPHDQKLKADLIFAYIYGFLHYPEYQKLYLNNFIKQDIPRIFKPASWKDFANISRLGQMLLDLHVYPDQAPFCSITRFAKGGWKLKDDQYSLKKMKFKTTDAKKDRTTIIFNEYITLTHIPIAAYDWILGNKSAIEHVMHGYQFNDKKNSDPNDFTKIQGDPKYILKLLFKVIYISCQTLKLVQQLPKYNDVEWDQQDINRSNSFFH